MTTWISTAEAAQRLGVKPETVYAYVSRGLLVSRPAPGGRGSVLAREQVDALAAGGRRGRGSTRVHRFRSVSTSVSHSSADALYYRGTEVAAWSRDHRLEDGVELVLGVRPGAGSPEDAPPALPVREREGLARAPLERRVAGAVLRWAERGWGTTTEPGRAARVVAGAVPALADALGPPGPSPGGDVGLSARVLVALTGRMPQPDEERAADTLLLQLLDHGLTASTTATRAAASARAGVADCLLAGYAVLAGAAHGAASARMHRLLAAEMSQPGSVDPGAAARAAGFGHFLYRDGDPRAEAALSSWATVAAAEPVLQALQRLRRRLPPEREHEPNVDAAIAVATLTLGLAPGAGPALFAWARTAGLAAHAAEELGEDLLRWRGRAATRAAGPPGP